jgi:hypothetical protein
VSDFGEGKWIIGRKRHRCDGCFGPIPKGETHYNYRGIWQGEWQNWRMHEECFEGYDAEGDGEFTLGSFEMPDRVRALLVSEQAAEVVA